MNGVGPVGPEMPAVEGVAILLGLEYVPLRLRATRVRMAHDVLDPGLPRSDKAYPEGFLRRERDGVERVRRSAERRVPAGLRYDGIPGLSAEAAEKLERHRPRTLGQAARIPGVTPAAISLLLARLVAGERTESRA